MKAIVVKKIGSFEITDIPKPSPRFGEVLVKVAVAGFCRTDLKLIEVGHRDLVLPRVPAEEVVGTICETVSFEDMRLVGKRVYLYPGTSCGKCKLCVKGAGNLCASMQIMGFHRDGGFAEYVAAPIQCIIEIPENTPFEEAVFAEPLSCCLNALELARLQEGESIAIWGGGPAGTLLTRASKTLGAEPTVIEPDERRRALVDGVSRVPATSFDVAIVAVGSANAYQEAIDHLNPRGKIVVFSGLPSDDAKQTIDMNRLHYHEQTIVGAYGCSFRHGSQAIDWISTGKIEVSDMISHRFPLEKLGMALDLVRKRQGMKILLYPSETDTRGYA